MSAAPAVAHGPGPGPPVPTLQQQQQLHQRYQQQHQQQQHPDQHQQHQQHPQHESQHHAPPQHHLQLQQQHQQQHHGPPSQTHSHSQSQSHASSPAAGNDKSRKKSAHWSDSDTDILVDILLRYRESGRTADNGFKAEVWDEASQILDANVYMGGRKTPDVCKSRWQRLQREYKVARELETFPGFAWDRNEHRLCASEAAWEAAEKVIPDARKHKKIHLVCYDRMGLLCSQETRPKQRPPKPRMPSSSSTITSESSGGAVSLNLTPTNGLVMSNGQNGLSNHGSLQPSLITSAGPETSNLWPDGDDSVESVDASFAFVDGTRHFAMPTQKRMQQYDTTMMAQAQHHSPKRQRVTRPGQLTQPPTPTPPQPTPPLYNIPLEQRSMVQPQTPSQPQTMHTQPTPTITQSRPATGPQQTPQTAFTFNQSPYPGRSPQFPTSVSEPVPSPLLSMPTALLSGNGDVSMNGRNEHHNGHPNGHHTGHGQNGNSNGHLRPAPMPTRERSMTSSSLPLSIHSPHAQIGHLRQLSSGARSDEAPALSNVPGTSSSPTQPGTPAPEVLTAGMTEAQRRTEAVLRIQDEELGDDDLLSVLHEFEDSIAAVDIYLALRNERVRAHWLRERVGRTRRR